MIDDLLDDLDHAFSRLREQLAAWLQLEAVLADRPLGWGFDMHAQHLDPEGDLARLRAGLPAASGELRREIQAEIDLLQHWRFEFDHLEQRDRDQVLGYTIEQILAKESAVPGRAVPDS